MPHPCVSVAVEGASGILGACACPSKMLTRSVMPSGGSGVEGGKNECLESFVYTS